ncbi:MAG: DUF6797 domain-containing protein [Verrucomicrobiaceae bacterium]
MKSLLIPSLTLSLLLSPSLHAQSPPPTSIPAEKTHQPYTPGTPLNNSRLYLRYSAEKSPTIELDDFSLPLPTGQNLTADLTFEHLPNHPATIHLTTSNDPTTRRIEIPNSLVPQGPVSFKPRPGKNFPMDGPFALLARFSTTAPNGTLASRAPATGIWAKGGKTLFLRDGILHYDVGWVGEINGGPIVNDGKEHLALVTFTDEGKATLYLDGKQVASRKKLTSPDKKDHLFKIGSTATDFAHDFKDGTLSQILYWKRPLTPREIQTLTDQKTTQLNTPDFHWQNPNQSPSTQEKNLRQSAKSADKLLNQAPSTTPFQATVKFSNLKIHSAWTQPLETSDHQAIIRSWGKDSLARGQKIYNQLCITCHGNEQKEGSIPLALKFHQGQFKNGSDPFRIYQTLTKGYGTMMPMPQFSTRQKYDVIHYIRSQFLEKSNPSQLTPITDSYLQKLPRGQSLIEEKETTETIPPYKMMDFGNVLFGTYQIEPGPIDENVNIAQKGIAIRLDLGLGGISKGNSWAVYDHDTMRLAAIYTGDQFVDWKGIDFDGSHGTHTSIVGKRILTNPDKPGWAHPKTGSWEPIRTKGKDGRLFGPLPKDWVNFRGMSGSVLRYDIGDIPILELIKKARNKEGFIRIIQIEPHSSTLTLRLQPHDKSNPPKGLIIEDGSLCFKVPPSKKLQSFTFHISSSGRTTFQYDANHLVIIVTGKPDESGFPPIPVTTQIQRGDESGPFAVDTLTVPDLGENPHNSWMRTSGFDFYPDGKRAAICTWMGDVWIVEGIDQLQGTLTWKRICSGLFQPLGLKIIDDKIHVTCRDQLAKLHDYNGDETIDYIECLNNDHQVTEHFHEFAMGLQTDAEGNFYYAKSARHAKDSLVPHHGTLLRISADGSRTDILATGFRAANGVCLNPDGTFIVTDQEGHWNPKNRINWVNGDGPTEFFGNIYGYSPVTDTADAAMKNPLCWITNAFDRSPSELLWVPQNAKWGPLNGQLLNLSYGYGKIHVVPHETINGQRQGGMCELPLTQFPTGIMRGRFHPTDGQLYGCGMFAWAGTQQQPGGFYRIRKTEHPAHLPTKIQATKTGVSITLSDEIDPSSISPGNFIIRTWDLKRSKNYGSKHLNERELHVTAGTLLNNIITLTIPDLNPTWGMSIEMNLTSSTGEKFTRLIHNSIFHQPN